MEKITLLIAFFFLTMTCTLAQRTFPLYDGPVPNSKPAPDEEVTTQRANGTSMITKISKPTLSVFLPAKENANGTAIVICPGGGYAKNAITHEGIDVAKKFAEMGIAAFVLKYRLPDEATMVNKEIGPLQDAQQAIRIVRLRAAEWNIDPDRVGIIGFSAGGHLASTAGTHFDKAVIPDASTLNLRPDFMILIYPVISFQDRIGHMGSRNQLIGQTPSPEKVTLYSNELQVNENTPPTFLVHASDDKVVIPENSILFYQQLVKHNVPAELHIYQKGGHGFGMNNKTTKDQWMERCKNWLDANGWLAKP